MIQFLSIIVITIVVLGMVLIVALGIVWRHANNHLKLKKHRSQAAGLADLLNYAAVVDDGIIVGKNGAFMAAWFYRGADNASATDAERELMSFRMN